MYNVSGNTYRPCNTSVQQEKLEIATYKVGLDDFGYKLVRVENMKLPEKVYGSNTKISEKIIRLFEDNVGETSGVMLSGFKGTGKTLTAIESCQLAISKGYPVLLLQDKQYGPNFNSFLESIKQPCVVFIDEFEKLFDDNESMKSTIMLLDGAIKSHKLFLLTSNTALGNRSNLEFLHNRPSRVFYCFEYGGLEDEVVVEYCEDKLEEKSYLSEILAFKRCFKTFSIDILKAIVSELNRYKGQPFYLVMQHLNVTPDRTVKDYDFNVELNVFGQKFDARKVVQRDYSYRLGSYQLNEILNDGDSTVIRFTIPTDGIDGKALEDALRSCGHSFDENETPISKEEQEELTRQGVEWMKSRELRMKVTGYDLTINLRLDSHSEVSNVTQDEKTRAITFQLADGVTLTYTPILVGMKSVQKFYI